MERTAAAKTRMRLTADDLLDLDVPEHIRGYELENGELVEIIVPSVPHGRLQAQVIRHLGNYVEENSVRGEVYAELDIVLGLRRDPERVRRPDISFMTAESLHSQGGEPARGFFRGVPDLIIELDSPGQRPSINEGRIQDYLDAGVRLLWVIHTDAASATMYHADGSARLVRRSEALEGEPVLPGFRLALARLFPEDEEAS
jgi:Uma2 family endonuclease